MHDPERREPADTQSGEPLLRKESVWQCCRCGQQYAIDPAKIDFENFICCVCSHIDCLVPVDD